MACALGAYLLLFAAGALALASLVLPTGAIALVATISGVFLVLAAGCAWIVDALLARRAPLASVTALRHQASAASPVAGTPRRAAAR
jgi:hypothetical protein